MNQRELIANTSNTINEINKKTDSLKKRVAQLSIGGNDRMAQSVLKYLEGIRDELNRQYSELQNAENNSDIDLASYKKNIYNSIQSYNAAFTRAGSIFRTK